MSGKNNGDTINLFAPPEVIAIAGVASSFFLQASGAVNWWPWLVMAFCGCVAMWQMRIYAQTPPKQQPLRQLLMVAILGLSVAGAMRSSSRPTIEQSVNQQVATIQAETVQDAISAVPVSDVPKSEPIAIARTPQPATNARTSESESQQSGQAQGSRDTPSETVRSDWPVYDLDVQPNPSALTITGLVFWNSEPQPGISVDLCGDVYSSRCRDWVSNSITDANGRFLFVDVAPDKYVVSTISAQTGNRLYLEVNGSKQRYEGHAGSVIATDDWHLMRDNLRVVSPRLEERIALADIDALSWEAYPDADSYELSLESEYYDVITRRRVYSNTLPLQMPALSCRYDWVVTAFNRDSRPIARTPAGQMFYGHGAVDGCEIAVVRPTDGAETIKRSVTLEWTPLEQATYYRIYAYHSDSNDYHYRNDYIEPTVTSLSLSNLQSGRHVWYVYAFDEAGNKLAETDIHDFTINR